jgi:endonuclease/exonuclease/phosphatase family metal-dependent hydrolase
MTPRTWSSTLLVIAALCAGPAVAQQPAAERSDAAGTLTVMTYNIHHGEGIDGRLDLERVARVITESGATIVGLQEVDRGVERTGRRDLLKELADLTGMALSFGKNIDHQGGDYGNAILTSHPIVSEGNRLLPNPSASEQRGLLQAVVDVEGQRTLVLVTHLDFGRDDSQRVASGEEILKVITAWGDGPVVVMGDFNDVPGSRVHSQLTGTLVDVWDAVGKGDGFTSPVETPRRRIDWILVRGFEPVSAEVPRTDASDHLPVVATLRRVR